MLATRVTPLHHAFGRADARGAGRPHPSATDRAAMPIDYDANVLSGWSGMPRLFFRYRGTILHGTIFDPIMWLTNVLHAGWQFCGGRLPIWILRPSSNATDPDDGEWVLWEGFELWKVKR